MNVVDKGIEIVAAGAREYLTFRLGQEEYGIDILKVQEIRGYEAPTRIAHAPRGNGRAKPRWSWKFAVAQLAPQSGLAEGQRGRQAWATRVTYQLGEACKGRIRQVIKTGNGGGHALLGNLGRACLLLACLRSCRCGGHIVSGSAKQSAVAFSRMPCDVVELRRPP